MTDPVTLASASVAAALSAVIAYLSWPRSPSLDGERFFKLVMSTLLRGRVEAAGGDVVEWRRRVVEHVPYHPAGRYPERKATLRPLGDITASIDGEQALSEKLATLPGPLERFRYMYEVDEVGLAARLDDPFELGPAYDPSTRLGTIATWDAVADWGAGTSTALPEALARRVPAVWILVDGRREEPVLDALEALLPDTARIPWKGLDTESLETVAAARMEDPATRFVLVGAEAGIQVVLRLLVEKAPLRDRVRAVVAIGGVLEGDPDDEGPLGKASLEAWTKEHWTHHRLDTEVTRQTPYFAVQWLDPATDPPSGRGQPVERGRFPEAKVESLTQEYVAPVDLGVIYERTEPDLVARGLWATVAMWTAG